jgi:hypothetical protein
LRNQEVEQYLILENLVITGEKSRTVPTVTNTQFIRFDSQNYTLLYLSNQYIVSMLDIGIGLLSKFNGDNLLIPGEGPPLFAVFKRLLHGIRYRELLAILPTTIKDKEAFVAELWQNGVIL